MDNLSDALDLKLKSKCLIVTISAGEPYYDTDGVLVATDQGPTPTELTALYFARKLADDLGLFVVSTSFCSSRSTFALLESIDLGADYAVRIPNSLGTSSIEATAALVEKLAGRLILMGGSPSGHLESPASIELAAKLKLPLVASAYQIASHGGPGHKRMLASRHCFNSHYEELEIRDRAVVCFEATKPIPMRSPLAKALSLEERLFEFTYLASGQTGSKPSGGLRTIPFKIPSGHLAPPLGKNEFEKLSSILGVDDTSRHGETIDTDPASAALLILKRLRGWGILEK
ncbi:MAG: hypothetical protein HKL81_08480 [Acidimicrobiaceae bacterium]|nr:hypothetical protein [Acidimicrobiaceae bacterium]